MVTRSSDRVQLPTVTYNRCRLLLGDERLLQKIEPDDPFRKEAAALAARRIAFLDILDRKRLNVINVPAKGEFDFYDHSVLKTVTELARKGSYNPRRTAILLKASEAYHMIGAQLAKQEDRSPEHQKAADYAADIVASIEAVSEIARAHSRKRDSV